MVTIHNKLMFWVFGTWSRRRLTIVHRNVFSFLKLFFYRNFRSRSRTHVGSTGGLRESGNTLTNGKAARATWPSDPWTTYNSLRSDHDIIGDAVYDVVLLHLTHSPPLWGHTSLECLPFIVWGCTGVTASRTDFSPKQETCNKPEKHMPQWALNMLNETP